MHPLSRPALAVGAVAIVLALSACGSTAGYSPTNSPAPSRTDSAEATSYPYTIENCGVRQSFDQAPSRVVILNGQSIAEVQSVIALGLDKAVLANAQRYGVYDEPGMAEKINALPSANGTTPAGKDIPAETLLSLKPDLVLANSSAAFDAGKGMATREQLAAIGAKTLVNPAQCALGKPDATPNEKEDLAKASWTSAKDYYMLLGHVFDVKAKAVELSDAIDRRVTTVQEAVQKEASSKPGNNDKPQALIAFPGMSMMNSSGLPAIMTGTSYDALLEAAGTSNAFSGKDRTFTRSLSAEQLAAAKVEVLVLGGFNAAEDLDAEAAKLFAAYPQWEASKNKRYVTLADSAYLGPQNAIAIEKIAKVAHPDAFN